MDYAEQTRAVLRDFFENIAVRRGDLVVLGLSTSEVTGGQIGKASAPEVGKEIVGAVIVALRERGVDIAVQCCEHLNRALVMERVAAKARGYTRVSAVPYPDAGGSAAAAAYRMLSDAVLVEKVYADAGIDIGVTMIGMHIADVAVPVRCAASVGAARVDFAYARPKLIGGERAKYK